MYFCCFFVNFVFVSVWVCRRVLELGAVWVSCLGIVFLSLMFFLLVAFSAQAYLNSDALSRYPEIELYEAVQAWLRHDRRRWRHTDTIVQSIRFCLMTPADIFEKVSAAPGSGGGGSSEASVLRFLSPQVKTSEFYRYSRQLRQEVDQALGYFHDVNQQPLLETRSNRIRSVRPQTAVFRGMIGHSMVNSKILLLQRPKVTQRRLFGSTTFTKVSID